MPGCPDGGQTNFSVFHPGRFNLVVACPADSTLIIKTTFHPNWHVTVDGVEVPTSWCRRRTSAISMPAGTHQVEAVYQATPVKTPLFIAGVGMLGLLLFVRGRLDRPGVPGRLRRRAAPAESGQPVAADEGHQERPGGEDRI